jgi:FAD/FMN-containing dehydrogenase
VYELFGGIGKRAALVHDYLYSSVCAPCLREYGRVWADVFFCEALRAHGTSWYKRTLMYGAIRVVGWYFFQPLTLVPPTPPAPPLEGSAASPGVYIPSDIAIKGVRSDGTNYDI